MGRRRRIAPLPALAFLAVSDSLCKTESVDRPKTKDQRPNMTPLSRDALKIWRAGVAAVGSEQLVHSAAKYDCDNIEFGDFRIRASDVDRVLVVGAGKAGTGMAAALEEIFGPDFGSSQRLEGWVNVPAGCERSPEFLHLHPARPQGVNEPTEAGCEGTRRMLGRGQNLLGKT